MLSEEKEAIEYFKRQIPKLENIIDWNETFYINPIQSKILKNSLITIINLIDKQQKEIQRLEKDNDTLSELVIVNEDKVIKELDLISKDKIREKIEHYNNELEHIKNGEEFENEEPMYYWGKVALENLLEEN